MVETLDMNYHEFTYEDGALVPESHEHHLRTDNRRPERSWRPQRPHC